MAAAAPAALDCWGALEEQALTEVVSTALGRPVRLAGFETTAVAYEPGSPATGALLRVAGATADGQPWSVFLKVLQHRGTGRGSASCRPRSASRSSTSTPGAGSWPPGSPGSPTGSRPACTCPACTA